ncbi:MAG: alanine and proline-rich secreted protein Apa [Oscillospiraceae bacterium]|nr:alanine and proline-rich secreted protein Apa [Oscillospiraceae bacterium]
MRQIKRLFTLLLVLAIAIALPMVAQANEEPSPAAPVAAEYCLSETVRIEVRQPTLWQRIGRFLLNNLIVRPLDWIYHRIGAGAVGLVIFAAPLIFFIRWIFNYPPRR